MKYLMRAYNEYSMHKESGFTLIEILITVAIIGILAAIAYPSYQESVAKSRRADAQSALLGLASAMERFYSENSFSYIGAAQSGDGSAPQAAIYPSEAPLDGNTKYYDLIIATETATNFSLTAKPKSNMSSDRCGSFTLNSAGVRNADETDCWK